MAHAQFTDEAGHRTFWRFSQKLAVFGAFSRGAGHSDGWVQSHASSQIALGRFVRATTALRKYRSFADGVVNQIDPKQPDMVFTAGREGRGPLSICRVPDDRGRESQKPVR